ncbi:MAG: hypothetical protein KatS3mg111_2368 [Pirellulaceae bacterium]|nr:MAG: hypothetical protein KatS3mg111_2368 [Pirellulaceae bacterium]
MPSLKSMLLLPLLLFISTGCESLRGPQPDATVDGSSHSGGPGAETAPPSIDTSGISVEVPQPTQDEPVAFGIAVAPASVPVGGEATLVVDARILPPWHIYASEGPTGVGIPTQLELELPQGITATAWSLPDSHVEQSPLGPMALYEGSPRFVCRLHLDPSTPPGRYSVNVKVKYQACNQSQCLPPKTTPLSAELTIVAPQ